MAKKISELSEVLEPNESDVLPIVSGGETKKVTLATVKALVKTGGIAEENDPTVPSHVKNITEANISTWNNKAEKSDIPTVPTKVSELTNDSSFATESFVTNAIANAQIGGGDVDLSGYATKDDLTTKVDKVTGKSLVDDTEIERLKTVVNYDDTAIKESINGKANATHTHKKADITDLEIPTKTSQLTNDSDFTTKSYVDNAVANAGGGGEISNSPTTTIPIYHLWVGSQEAYEAIGTLDANTKYSIIEE